MNPRSVLTAVAAGCAVSLGAQSASGEFVGFVAAVTQVTTGGVLLDVIRLVARFNGPTDTVVAVRNLSYVGGACVADPYGAFYHKDNSSYNGGVLSKQYGTWAPSLTGSPATSNPSRDSYLVIGGAATATNTTSADSSWNSGGSGSHAGGPNGWSRPDLLNNGAIGWFNSSVANNQGRVGVAPNTATDVLIAQFVIDRNAFIGNWRLTIEYNDGSAGAPSQVATAPFLIGYGSPATNLYRDIDGDGYGYSGDGTLLGCPFPGFVTNNSDNCPSIANPGQEDCNANGVGDVCEIAAGTAPDCDLDGLSDYCEGAILVRPQSTLLPIAGGTPAVFEFSGLSRAYGRPPKLILEATADLGAANDGLVVSIDGTSLGTFFLTSGTDCPTSPDLAAVTVPITTLNQLVADGRLVVRAEPFGAVNSQSCGVSGGVRFRLDYDGLPASSDCNSNGQLDSCEVGSGTVPDCNSNGKPDSCDISSGFSADCNSNGRPDSCDIAIGSSSDFNTNGVPDDCGELIVGGSGYATIAAAVAAAPSGATIRVAPGTYTGTVVLDSKPITIRSIGGAAVTTISGVGATSSMLAIRSGAANGCVIDGFTFRDGSSGTAAYGVRVGGAMFLENTTATIRNCRFINNSTEYGGGIYGLGFSGVIEDCLFQGNTAQFNSGGVQLGFGGTCVFRRNTLRQNTAQNGGGMHLVNWFEGAVTNVSLSDCVFEQNTATAEGGALYWYGSVGQNLAVERCIVLDNSATDGAFVRVGGALSFAMSNSRFCRNAPVDVVGSIVNLGGNGFGTDCNGNGICDGDELVAGTATDCNNNGVLDSCDLVAGTAFDCNANGIVDTCDIASGTSGDVDSNGIPDDCKPDCDNDEIPDAWEIQTGQARDCDSDGVPDNCEITQDPGKDKNANGHLDTCELDRGDLNLDGFVNAADLSVLLAFWGVPQPPVGDLNRDGIIGGADLSILLGNWGTTP
jgi:hypothetical protein